MPLPPAPQKRAQSLRYTAQQALATETTDFTPATKLTRGAKLSRTRHDHAAASAGNNPTRGSVNAFVESALIDNRAPTLPTDFSQVDVKNSGLKNTASAKSSFNKTALDNSDFDNTGFGNTRLSNADLSKKRNSKFSKKPKTADADARKLFVLDTNVLLHDPMSLYRFEEHDIFLPLVVLEELDANKKGMTEVARNARQVSRQLDSLASLPGSDIATGLALAGTGHRAALGKLYFQTEALHPNFEHSLPQGKADNQILGVVQALMERDADLGLPKNRVVLVSKDINMRVKARALGLNTDDYQNDKALEDGDLLYNGALALPANFWDKHSKNIESWQQGGFSFYRIKGPIVSSLLVNQFVYFEAPGEPSMYARVSELRGDSAVLKTLKDYGHAKNAVWGVSARNREQNFAMNLLMDPDIDFVTLTGTAGTGKTLIALACGLQQVLDERRYTEIIMTRATVSVGDDIGFLPGTEEEKMGPWMGALDDNLEFLGRTDTTAGEWGRAATNELIRSKIKIKSLNFMRGRTFLAKYLIIDEAQNLTPKQIKTLITRAGPGTKIICMGNLAQIDTPYLTEGSSGLTFAVDRFKGWAHGGHILLARGERSRLADFASEVL